MAADTSKTLNFFTPRRQKMLAGGVWILLLVTIVWINRRHNLGPFETIEFVSLKIKMSPWGPLLFVGAYTLLPLLFFSATALTVVSGALFGPVWGVVYTVLGTSVSSSVAYLIGKFFGRDLILSCRPDSITGACAKKLRSNSFFGVLTLRCLLVPFDLVNYVAGAVGVTFSAFLGATILGSLAPMVFFVQVGHSAGLSGSETPELNPFILVGSLFVMLLGLICSKLWSKKNEKKETSE